MIKVIKKETAQWEALKSAGSHHLSMGPQLGLYFNPQPSGLCFFSAIMSSNSSAQNLVKPHFFEIWIFW
jgi:hypothetical protein